MYLLFFILWIVFNGSITPEICIFGIVIAGVIFLFTCKFTDYSIQTELRNYRKILCFLKYICLLIREILKANIGVIHMILTQEEEIQPLLVSFDSDLKTPTARAFLANAITLTPGTITVTLEENRYTVHCLDEIMAEGLQDTEFARQLKDMEE